MSPEIPDKPEKLNYLCLTPGFDHLPNDQTYFELSAFNLLSALSFQLIYSFSAFIAMRHALYALRLQFLSALSKFGFELTLYSRN